jgi:hypothetical protein
MNIEQDIDAIASKLATIEKIVSYHEFQARNTTIEAMIDILKVIVLDEKVNDLPDALNILHRFVKDAFAASFHVAYLDEICTEEEVVSVMCSMYNYSEEEASKAFKDINTWYKKGKTDGDFSNFPDFADRVKMADA